MPHDEEASESEWPTVTPVEGSSDQACAELETEGGQESRADSMRDRVETHAGIGATATGGSVEVHMHYPSPNETEEPEIKLKDLTVPLDAPQSEVVKAEHKIWFNALLQSKVLVLTSFDTGIVFDAGFSIVNQFEGDKRFLTFKKAEEGLPEINIDTLLACNKLWASPTLILVDATSPSGQSFVESVVRKPGWLLRSTSLLKESQSWLLILTNLIYLPTEEGVPFAHYSVPFVEPRLREKFPEEVTDLAEKLQRQRDLGLWEREEGEFWRTFDDFLKHDLLAQEIEKRSDPKYRVIEKSASSLVNIKAELETSALFLAAFFPNLSFEEFDDALVCLLGDRVGPVKSVLPLGEGQTDDQMSLIPRNLVEEWRENYSEILQRCHLMFLRDVSKASYGSSVGGVFVAFDTPELRVQVREEFLVKHYPVLIRIFAEVIEKRFLFHPESSVVDGTLQLLRTMALINPQRYGSKLLLTLKADLQAVGAAAQGAQGVVTREGGSKLLLSRLYLVIRALLPEESLRDVVHQFFTDLINCGRHEDLLELVKRLRFAAGFNQVYWWKQLLDRGQTEAREKAYRGMLAILLSGGSQVQEILTELKGWLPDPGQEAKSESARRANQLLIDLLEVPIKSKSRLTSLFSPGEALRSALCDTTASDAASNPILGWIFHTSLIRQMQEHLARHSNMLVWTWVLNPSVKRYLHTDTDRMGSRWFFRLKELPSRSFPFMQTAPSALVFQALVLGDFAASIRAVKSNTDAYQSTFITTAAESVAKLCTEEQRLLLESYWGEMMNLLLEVHAAIRPPDGIEDETFRTIRTRLEEQYEGVAELRANFSEVVAKLSATGE